MLLGHCMMPVNQQLVFHRCTPMVVLIMTAMAIQTLMMLAMMTTVLLGLPEQAVTIMTKMVGQTTNSTTSMGMFSASIGNLLSTVMVMDTGTTLDLIVALQNMIPPSLMETYSHSTLHNTKTKMAMVGATIHPA